jgi:ABC-type sugar transport system ATPase subunit
MNLIRLGVEDGAVRLGGQTIRLPDKLASAVGERQAREIIVGVRPEHVSIANGAGEGEAEGIPGEVVLVESLGADSYVHTTIEGSETSFVARTEGYDARKPGTNIRLRIDPARIYGFDAETEERLGAKPAREQAAPAQPASAAS